MTKSLYVDLYNLITDSMGEQEEMIKYHLEQASARKNNPEGIIFKDHTMEAVKYFEKLQELQDILKRFEDEVEEPD